MLKERLHLLFTGYDSAIQSLIADVLNVEQAHISMERPHLKEPIDTMISRIAAKEVDHIVKSDDENRCLFE